MPRSMSRSVPALLLLAGAGLSFLSSNLSGQSAAMGFPSTSSGEWPHYSGDVKGSRYAPLDQIDATNFNKLEVAWRLKTDNLGPRLEYKLEGTPLMVKGVLYAVGGTRRAVVALDAKTGEQKWIYSLDEGRRADVAPRKLSGRGLSYWTDGKGDERIVFVTIGYRLVELDAKTGDPIASFGTNGMIDLKDGVVYMKDKPIPLETGEIGTHSTPLVVKDTIIVQSSMAEGLRYEFSVNAKGLVRAFDARTGKQLWRFNTIPYPGEPGNETWENGSWEWTGNVGVWTEMSADPDAGLVYLPVESPTIDIYGGNRPGNNLYAESLVAVDLATGKKRWHYQLVHHPIWDYDAVGAPLVVDANIDGTPRKLVAQASKQGWLYVFDRITGKPIWPMPERSVPQSDVPGEKTSPTQPFPSKPPAYSRNYLAADEVIDFTPALRQQALENLKKYRWEQTPYVPAVIPNDKVLGSITVGNTMGGVNWPGSGFDPETAT
jgi:quinoprotein glucose dehydrogenase